MNNSPLLPPTGPEIPTAEVRSQHGAGFWILIIGGCLGTGVVLLVVGTILVGIWTSIGDNAGIPAETSSSRTAGGPGASVPPGSNEPDDFIYKSKTSGLEYIAPNHVSAEGVSVTLAGEWREDHRSVVLRLLDGGRYELYSGGGSIPGSRFDMVASSSAEQGTWTFAGSLLTLTPVQLGLTGIGEGKQTSDRGKPDAPRQWSVVGVTIDYTPEGSETVKQRPGLHINGPGPSWYYPAGNWDWVLRSAK